jgi:hypothetical protein
MNIMIEEREGLVVLGLQHLFGHLGWNGGFIFMVALENGTVVGNM